MSNLSKKFDNLMKFIENGVLQKIAFEKIRSNKGSLTKGTDNKTIDETFITKSFHIIEQNKKMEAFNFHQ